MKYAGYLSIWGVSCCLLVLLCVDLHAEENNGVNSASPLWNSTVGVVLRNPLWSTRDAYDSAQVLMVPLHYAFVAHDTGAINGFERLFARYSRQQDPFGQLNQAQWSYLVSRYLALKVEFNYPFTSADVYLVKRLAFFVHSQWLFAPSFQWARNPFFGMKQRLDDVLSRQSANPGYYRAVIDLELFVLAVAADIKYVIDSGVSTGFDDEGSAAVVDSLNECNEYTLKVIALRGSFTADGGWLFQRGVWKDHPDFKYSGNCSLGAKLAVQKRDNVAEDSSHSHRWPLWLHSFYHAQIDNAAKKKIMAVYKSLSHQFKEHVVVFDDTQGYLLLNNYMDGYNGVYRYKYGSVGANSRLGYGPYELSGILGASWYPFLSGVGDVYRNYSSSYPLPEAAVDLYVGPNTTRTRNPLFCWPDYFTNGFARLVALQSFYLTLHYRL